MECPYIDEILGSKLHYNPEVGDCDHPAHAHGLH